MLRAVHDHGVDHPDLTAHNILLDPRGVVFLVDFDNANVRPPGRWRRAGVERLRRSLRKVALETGTEFDPAAWRELEAGYEADAAPEAGSPAGPGG
jgi:3-deoxy-D-manno-octulosonic acid kinase